MLDWCEAVAHEAARGRIEPVRQPARLPEPGPARPGEIDLSSDEQADVHSEIEIITSRSLLSRAILESGLNATIVRAGWRPVRYWQWLRSRRDATLLDGAGRELVVENTSLDPAIGTPQEYEVTFTSDVEYELSASGSVLGRGRLNEPLRVNCARKAVHVPSA